MENEEDVLLVIVSDNDNGENDTNEFPTSIQIKKKLDKKKTRLSLDNNIIQTVEKYGERIDIPFIREKLFDDDRVMFIQKNKEEEATGSTESDNECVIKREEESDEDDVCTKIRRSNMRKRLEQISFVDQLRKQSVREDTELLIKALSDIMRNLRPPSPPQDFYIMKGINFECRKCGYSSGTLPAAENHYQEKHGKRYLICYACGVNYRSKNNLYRHEMRCSAPDAEIVLKARALCLGRKGGRSRPFLPKLVTSATNRDREPNQSKFECEKCPAVFISRASLQSHEYMHRGLLPFRCDQCPAAYTSSSALCRHRKKHMNVQHICDHCNRSFKIKAALVAHLDTHLPEKKFKCEDCGKRFARKFALVLHVNSKHRHLPPPCACQMCPKRYRRISELKIHMQREHGMVLMTRKMYFRSLSNSTKREIEKAKVVLKSEEPTFVAASSH